MRKWAKYFFGSFFKGRLAREGSNRSIVNAIGGCVLAAILMIIGLYTGHIASFSHLWNGAQSYRDAIYDVFSSGALSFEIQNGTASSASAPYASAPGSQPVLLADFRDIEHTYVAFSVGYVSEDGHTITEEAYLALTETEKENYSFYVDCTDAIIDPSESANIAQYQEYLSSLPDTSAFSKLDPHAADYPDQLYALYITSMYPEVAAPPVLLNYYNQLLDELGQEEYFILLPNHCFVSFLSGDVPVSISGHYTQDLSARDLVSAGQIDHFFSDLFSSSTAITLFIYLYNLPRSLPTILIVLLLLSLCSYVVCRSKKLEFGDTFLSSVKVCGSFLFFSGVLAGIFGFAGSFYAPQSQMYSMTLQAFSLIYAVRCVIFLVGQLIFHGDASLEVE